MPGPLSATSLARTGVVADPRWSPDGQRLGWVEARAGRFDLVVADGRRGAPGASERAPAVVTAETGLAGTRSTGGGRWCWVGPTHVAVVDPDGRLVLVSIGGGSARVVSRDGRALAPAASADGRRLAFVLEREDACDVAVVELDPPSWPRRLSHSDFAWDPVWSPEGTRVAWHEWDLEAMSWEASRIAVADVATDGGGAVTIDGATKVVAGGPGVSVGQPRFSPAGDALAWVSDERGWWNVVVADATGNDARPVLSEPFEHAEPAWGVGQRSFAWSPDGRTIVFCRNEDGFGRLVAARADGVGEPDELARGWHHGLDWGPGGIVAVRSGARTPPQVCVLRMDGAANAAARPEKDERRRDVVANAAPTGFHRERLVEPEAVTWAGDDGATVHGLLFRPRDVDAGIAPLVVDVHGGPTGQAVVQWKPLHQHLLSRGVAVLAPDPRGSTGYGRAYAQALAGRWGELDVADCAAGIRAAGDRGWCDPSRVVVSGASSGGLVALLLAVHRPDLLHAVMTMYPVTDLLALAATTHRFESRANDWLIGALPGAAAEYRDRSPITHAASIDVPVLVLHGDSDRVVPPAQVVALVDAIRGAGGTVEHHLYPGEGHGWSSDETIVDVHGRIDDFLRRHGAPA